MPTEPAPLPRAAESRPARSADQKRVPSRRYSTEMVVGGIVLTSSAPAVFLGNFFFFRCPSTESGCSTRNVLVLVTTLSLLGAGIPLIIAGNKRVPVTQVQLAPWLSPDAGGLSVRGTL